jgi:hypothetical protein
MAGLVPAIHAETMRKTLIEERGRLTCMPAASAGMTRRGSA